MKPIIDEKSKKIMFYTPRCACTIYLKIFLTHIGKISRVMELEKKNKKSLTESVHSFAAKYKIVNPYSKKHIIGDYFRFKVIRNPYSRAISIISFIAKYLPTVRKGVGNILKLNTLQIFQIIEKNKFKFIFAGKETKLITSHCKPQYVPGEEKYISKYIRVENGLEENAKELGFKNVDITKINAKHHVKKCKTEKFFGLTPLEEIKKFPANYKLFYNKEIKTLVTKLYESDIEHYGYTFSEDW